MDALYEESLNYLREAYDGISNYHEIDEFVLLFEANDESTQEQVAKNTEASNKAQSGLKKAIDALKQLIANIIDAVTSFFNELFASKENKEAYREFVAAVKADPQLKDKKVSYNDYTKVMKEYDAAIAEAEKVDIALAQGKQADAEKSIRRLTELVSGSAQGIATSVGVEFLENLANSDELTAKGISLALQADRRILDNIEKSIGEKNANKFVKDINALAGTRISLRRLIIKLRQKKYNSMEDATKDFVNSCKKTFSSKASIIASIVSPRGLLKRVAGNEQIQTIVKGKDAESKLIKDTAINVGRAKRSGKLHGSADAVVDNITTPISDAINNAKASKDRERLGKMVNDSKGFWGIGKGKKEGK